jgi:DNA polymerase III delta subunit
MHYKPKQLFEVIVKEADYESDAIDAAMALINEQGLYSSLQIVLNRNAEKKKQKEEERIQKIKEKEEHYQQVSQFQEDGIVFSVSLDNVTEFEKRLTEEGIEYYGMIK